MDQPQDARKGAPALLEPSLLSIQGAGKTFEVNGKRVVAFEQIDIEVAGGGFTAIIGPSGCGKSTLLQTIAGLQRLTDGQVLYDGRAIESPTPEINYIFQQYSKSVFPWRTVSQNIAFGLEVKGMGKREIASLCEEYVTQVGLDGYQNHYPSQLSGGMQQRVAIARALVCRPRVLLMDEPFSAVDALTRAQLQNLILRVWQENALTVIFVTHDVDEATYLADRVIAMRRPPSGISSDLTIELPYPRNQVTTRESPDFIAYRHALFESVLGSAGFEETK